LRVREKWEGENFNSSSSKGGVLAKKCESGILLPSPNASPEEGKGSQRKGIPKGALAFSNPNATKKIVSAAGDTRAGGHQLKGEEKEPNLGGGKLHTGETCIPFRSILLRFLEVHTDLGSAEEKKFS